LLELGSIQGVRNGPKCSSSQAELNRNDDEDAKTVLAENGS
jgi:hypothetical protein